MDRDQEKTLFQLWREIYRSIADDVGEQQAQTWLGNSIDNQIHDLENHKFSSVGVKILISDLTTLQEFLERNDCTKELGAVKQLTITIQEKLTAIEAKKAELAVAKTDSTEEFQFSQLWTTPIKVLQLGWAKLSDKPSSPQQLQLHQLFETPLDVYQGIFTQLLNRRDLVNFIRTSHLFYKNVYPLIKDHVAETQLIAGLEHAFIIEGNGDIWAFGSNKDGQLGLGHQDAVSTPQFVHLPKEKEHVKIQTIAVDRGFSLFLFTDGTLYTAGMPGFIVNDASKQATISPVIHSILMGKSIKAIAAHDDDLLILDTENVLYGVAPILHAVNAAPGQKMLPTLMLDVIGLPFLQEGEKIQSMAIGENHIALLCNTGRAFARGDNSCGQLGCGHASNSEKDFVAMITPDKNIGIKAIAVGDGHSIILTQDNKVYTYGQNHVGQCGAGELHHVPPASAHKVLLPGDRQPKTIMSVYRTSFVICTDGMLCMFGNNGCQLLGPNYFAPHHEGFDTIFQVRTPTIVKFNKNIKIHAVAGTANYALVADTNGVIYGCGKLKTTLNLTNMQDCFVPCIFPLLYPKQQNTKSTENTDKDSSNTVTDKKPDTGSEPDKYTMM